jgi:hypothetical protein
MSTNKVPDRIDLKLVWADTIVPENVEWIWQDVIPQSELGYCYGYSGQGKSPLWTDICARVTAGAAFPGGAENTFGPRSVLMMSREDDWSKVVVPRIIAACGNPALVANVECSVITKDASIEERTTALGRDIGTLITTLKDWQPGKPFPLLILIDPFFDYIGEIKPKEESEVAPLLNDLVRICKRFNITIIILGHFNKRSDAAYHTEKVMGCQAMTRVPRFGFYVLQDKESSDKHVHELIPGRQSLSAWSGLKYSTTAVPLEVTVGKKKVILRSVVSIKWGGAAKGTTEDVGVKSASSEAKSDVEEASVIIHKFLAAGEKSCADCIEQLKLAGFVCSSEDEVAERRFHSRVRKKAGAESYQKSQRQWWWRLVYPEQASFDDYNPALETEEATQ